MVYSLHLGSRDIVAEVIISFIEAHNFLLCFFFHIAALKISQLKFGDFVFLGKQEGVKSRLVEDDTLVSSLCGKTRQGHFLGLLVVACSVIRL